MSEDRAETNAGSSSVQPWGAIALLMVAGYPLAFGTALFLADWEDWEWYAWVPAALGVLTAGPMLQLGWRRLRSRVASPSSPSAFAATPV